ncbi:hypothetical protein [Pseudoalteromonas peptidolytica]|uniref:hypothetical protein n=1 Tax=Pseudoalteromonas peptidolytica TaxID=61150 RepID=UPI00298EB7BF|nr:hypothetical protein [Pseudoalteromonas peptidolytica]MDW7551354.1 hypothetical protein [Pseudoalteromonas peptidolytica]
MSDQGAPRLETLLNKQDLQEILHGWGSPSSYRTDTRYEAVSLSRYYIHAFTGRVPTPAEIYYGMYINKKGELRKDACHHLREAYVGYIAVRNDYKVYVSAYRENYDVNISGRIFPDDVNLGYEQGAVRNPPKERNDTSMMMDITFSAEPTKKWSSPSSLNNLKNLSEQGLLVDSLKPTWFFISETSSLPDSIAKDRDIDRVYNKQNEAIAMINRLELTGDSKTTGLIFGTFGPIGSGAEIELSDGYDHVESVRMVSIKIKSN